MNTSVWWTLLVRACVFACEAHRVVMCISREASARWSVDGSLNYNYSYSRTFAAVTPRYRTLWTCPQPTTHAQQEFAILRTSVFDRDFVALLRQSFRGSWRWFLVILLLPSFFSQVSRCLKPGGRFISITFISPLIRKRLYARAEYDWSIRTHTYGGEFKYFVYVMTKGEELSPEDAALEKKLLQADESSTAPLVTMDADTQEEFLSSIKL